MLTRLSRPPAYETIKGCVAVLGGGGHLNFQYRLDNRQSLNGVDQGGPVAGGWLGSDRTSWSRIAKSRRARTDSGARLQWGWGNPQPSRWSFPASTQKRQFMVRERRGRGVRDLPEVVWRWLDSSGGGGGGGDGGGGGGGGGGGDGGGGGGGGGGGDGGGGGGG
ncbi:hypothetical protein Acr_28g0002210 [Actinidia rufa]|uniref:Uncharacterized protein n=1 Tax=Actinidia rufa TaxID=165716 RepID=A0A7J0H8W4_9ERIC|nr:hypothetical protein Acr_28g0002210 [Actinidia rufa]